MPEYFPASTHLDDVYHMVNINCVKHCPVHELPQMKPLVWKLVKTFDEFEFSQYHEGLVHICPQFYFG